MKALAVGLGAFLLFLLQPLAARSLLPRFGGAPSVWAVSLACYQSFLFVGYLIAHLIRRHVPQSLQGIVLIFVLAAGAATFPLLPVKAAVDGDSVFTVALAVLLGVGPLFVGLAVIGPLVQSWAGDASGDRAYRLYAVSNAASLAALLLFPTVLERFVDVMVLGRMWSFLYAAEIGLIAVIALNIRRSDAPPLVVRPSHAPSLGSIVGWMAWAASGVVVLNAVTTVLAQDLASMPMLWVVPLALYLLTWIVAFAGRLPGTLFRPAALSGAALGLLLLVLHDSLDAGPVTVILMTLGAMTAACLAAHGALAASRPDSGRLTSFYLAIAAGGAIGGVVSGLAAPSLGPRWTELALGFGAVALLAAIGGIRGASRRGTNVTAAMMLMLLVALLIMKIIATPEGTILQHRDFHGMIRVTEHGVGDPERHRLVLTHGATKHGAQFLAADLRREPTTYFAETTGCGIAVAAQRSRTDSPLHIGAVGLGVGTLAAYGLPGDEIVFYELSPAVASVAAGATNPAFTYLADSPASVDVVLGDARLSLTRELVDHPTGRKFDLLVLDAFAGDAVPMHLLTREAFAVYTGHLSSEGMIAAHVSSNWLDLRPVLYAWARAAGWRALTVSNRSAGPSDRSLISTWVLLFRDLDGLRALREQCLPLMEDGVVEVENMNNVDFGDLPPWTDGRGGLLDVLTTEIVAGTVR